MKAITTALAFLYCMTACAQVDTAHDYENPGQAAYVKSIRYSLIG